MCGRYFLSEIVEGIDATLEILQSENLRTGSNLAPTETLSALVLTRGKLSLKEVRWGLIPSWSRRDPSRERPLINARIETVQEKPSFRESFIKRRAILPAHGFIEWRAEQGKRKVPFRVGAASGEVVGLAAIWDSWRSPRGEMVDSAAVLTREASEDFKVIHHRLPVMLRAADWQPYLAGQLSEPHEVLAAARAVELLEVAPIGTAINRPGRQDGELLKPLKAFQTLRAS